MSGIGRSRRGRGVAEGWKCDDELMNVIEFEGTVTPNGQIALPAEIAGQLTPGESLHVVLQWDPSTDEDHVWRVQGRERFEAAYAPEDSIYEQLMDETSTR
jgi:hypothetical protein